MNIEKHGMKVVFMDRTVPSTAGAWKKRRLMCITFKTEQAPSFLERFGRGEAFLYNIADLLWRQDESLTEEENMERHVDLSKLFFTYIYKADGSKVRCLVTVSEPMEKCWAPDGFYRDDYGKRKYLPPVFLPQSPDGFKIEENSDGSEASEASLDCKEAWDWFEETCLHGCRNWESLFPEEGREDRWWIPADEEKRRGILHHDFSGTGTVRQAGPMKGIIENVVRHRTPGKSGYDINQCRIDIRLTSSESERILGKDSDGRKVFLGSSLSLEIRNFLIDVFGCEENRVLHREYCTRAALLKGEEITVYVRHIEPYQGEYRVYIPEITGIRDDGKLVNFLITARLHINTEKNGGFLWR